MFLNGAKPFKFGDSVLESGTMSTNVLVKKRKSAQMILCLNLSFSDQQFSKGPAAKWPPCIVWELGRCWRHLRRQVKAQATNAVLPAST